MHQSHTRHCHTVTHHIVTTHDTFTIKLHSSWYLSWPPGCRGTRTGNLEQCFYPFIYFDKKFICLISFPRADNYVNFCDICFALTDPANTYPICSGRSATVCRSQHGTCPLLCDCPCPPACGRYPRTPPAGQSRNWTLPSGCCWTVATTETRLSHFQRGHETVNTK